MQKEINHSKNQFHYSVPHLKILFIEDDKDHRTYWGRLLVREGHQVINATTTSAAINLLRKENFDLVLCKLNTKHDHGIEVLRFINQQTKKTQLLFFSKELGSMKHDELVKLGSLGFLKQPLSITKFNRTLLQSYKVNMSTNELHGSKKDGDQELGEQSSSIQEQQLPKYQENQKSLLAKRKFSMFPMVELFKKHSLEQPLFVKINNDKYIKIVNAAQELSKERQKSYITKGLHHFYVQSSDYPAIVKNSQYKMKKWRKSKKSSDQDLKSLAFVMDATKLLHQHTIDLGLNDMVFQYCVENFEFSLSLLRNKQNLFDLLQLVKQDQNDSFSHATSVMLLSLLLAKEMGIESEGNNLKICLSAFLHDTGLLNISVNLLNKPRDKWSNEDWEIYRGHPRRSADLLEGLKDVPKDLQEIILHHHERWDGKGFPNGIDKHHIHPIARILKLADFCANHMSGAYNGKPTKRFYTLLQEVDKKHHHFDPKLVRLLKTIQL